MNATQQLHDLGQSLWLDNITRGILNDGTLGRYIRELSVTGLTSNPTIFDHAITNGDFYDDAIRRKSYEGKAGEPLFFELAAAYMRGIERRIAAGLHPRIGSVASLFVSRWDVAVKDAVPARLHNRLGIAIAQRTYREYRRVLASPRWATLAAAGALPQRLLFASTSTKDPAASDILYVEALAAPDTVNTIPAKTLLAFADHGNVSDALSADGGDAEAVLAEFTAAGVDDAALADRLQREGAASFDASWKDLLERLARTRKQLMQRDTSTNPAHDRESTSIQ